MKKSKIIYERKGRSFEKDILIFENPKKLRKILNDTSFKILECLCEEPMYAAQIAEKLDMSEQKIYYHIKNLEESGVIKIVSKERKRGGTAKYLATNYPTFGVELPGSESEAVSSKSRGIEKSEELSETMKDLFDPLISNGKLNCKMVVGSPREHGKHKAKANDGHYAVQLALLLGRFVDMPKRFSVDLDVNVTKEKKRGENLILIGGPKTNTVTKKVNKDLPIKFDGPSGGWKIKGKGNEYTEKACGVVEKIDNPFNKENKVIILGGIGRMGTKAAIMALTNYPEKISEGKKENFSKVVKGFDFEGDGKVDTVEVLE